MHLRLNTLIYISLMLLQMIFIIFQHQLTMILLTFEYKRRKTWRHNKVIYLKVVYWQSWEYSPGVLPPCLKFCCHTMCFPTDQWWSSLMWLYAWSWSWINSDSVTNISDWISHYLQIHSGEKVVKNLWTLEYKQTTQLYVRMITSI